MGPLRPVGQGEKYGCDTGLCAENEEAQRQSPRGHQGQQGECKKVEKGCQKKMEKTRNVRTVSP